MVKKMKIFISCGQREKEKKYGLKVSKYFNKKYEDNLEMIFAEEIFDSRGLTDIIFKNLKECDGFIGIFHKREKINKNNFRSSLFVSQELAITSYLKKDFFRIYSEKGIEFEGVNKYLMNRDITFSSEKDIIEDLKPVIRSWISTFKPQKGLLFNKPIIEGIGNSGNNISQIILDISIDNQDPIIIENFQFGIIAPEDINCNLDSQQDWKVIKNIELTGHLSHFFKTKSSIFHIKYNGKINRYMSFNTKLNMNFSTDLKSFKIGFYMIDQSNRINTYSMEFNNLRVGNLSTYFSQANTHEIKIR